MDDKAKRWRELLLEVVEPHKDWPLMLSGGLDSGTLLAAQLACGGRPPVFAFRLDPGKSSDFTVAQRMARHFGLTFHEVLIERTEEELEAGVREAIARTQSSRKTVVQCVHPVMRIYEEMQRRGHDGAVIGTGGIVEDNRKVHVILHGEGEEAAREYRRKQLINGEPNATNWMKWIADDYSIEVAEPFSEEPFASYSLSLDMAEINTPKQKGIALRAFPEFWTAGAWYRKNSNLQVNSGVREWHETLLQSPLNRRGSVDLVGVYNDILKGVS